MTDKRGEGLKFDGGKLRPSLLPIESLNGILEVLEFGAQKYKANSWQTVPNGPARYWDALMRHAFAYQSGEKLDAETGLSHLKHMGCNILFLIWLEKMQEEHPEWPEDDSRIEPIGQNGNNGEHYEFIGGTHAD